MTPRPPLVPGYDPLERDLPPPAEEAALHAEAYEGEFDEEEHFDELERDEDDLDDPAVDDELEAAELIGSEDGYVSRHDLFGAEPWRERAEIEEHLVADEGAEG